MTDSAEPKAISCLEKKLHTARSLRRLANELRTPSHHPRPKTGRRGGMTNHPSFGPIPVEEFRKVEKAPYGAATRILRSYDPLFGRISGTSKKFKMYVSKRAMRTDTAIVEIEAADEAQARELIDHMEWDDFIWHDGSIDDEDDHEICNVEEVI